MILDFVHKCPHFEFLSSQEDLIRFWFRRQFNLVLFLFLSFAVGYFSTFNAIIKYVFYALLALSIFILFICAFISLKKTYKVWKLYKSSFKIFSINEKASPLVSKIFRAGRRYLFIILVLELLIPVAFIFKLLFFRNFYKLQKIVYLDR